MRTAQCASLLWIHNAGVLLCVARRSWCGSGDATVIGRSSFAWNNRFVGASLHLPLDSANSC